MTRVTDEFKSRKQIAFDLSQELLKEHHPNKPQLKKPHVKGYAELKTFFKSEKWEHRQGSVYASVKELTYIEITEIMYRASKKMPWLPKCLTAIDVTNIGNQHSLMDELQVIARQIEKENQKQPMKPLPTKPIKPN
ncbi:MAG: hypothetical protein FWB72_03995 [Firmicutes bacterium]|nr:hypothetical protein [Bacillota bacterium]